MYMTLAKTLVLHWMCCELCLSIKVPVVWNDESDNSEVNNFKSDEDFSVDSFQAQNGKSVLQYEPQTYSQSVPKEYFQYTAKKPQFAVDIAKYHGVQSPENHYSAYPIRPYTGVEKPDLGKHQIFNKENAIYQPFQKYTSEEKPIRPVVPVSSNYEVYHPYKAEEAGLSDIYKDPVLDKIRKDIKDNKDRLQKYENEAGQSDVSQNEYLESPEETDRKKYPERNVPVQFEIHRPLRRPIYYRVPPPYNPSHHHLNQRFRHPFNQNYIKIKPMHYRPLQNQLQRLRQNHALKYDDEQNEYPQVAPVQKLTETPDGYDIYERGKENYVRLRNNIDESINKAVEENRPTIYQKLELQDNGKKERYTNDDESKEEEEFVPLKSYAQVRKTETTKHLPRLAALEEAASLDELINAPRLKEAVKSTKAQTFYTEEGYEDSAYDHAGEQKHASDHEGHGGFLKEKELSGGKYKIPSVSSDHEDGGGSVHGAKILHGEKWKDDNKDSDVESEAEDYADDEHKKYVVAENNQDTSKDDPDENENERSKRENDKTKGNKYDYVTDEEHNKDSDRESEIEDYAHDEHKKHVVAENNQDGSKDYSDENENERSERENDKTKANKYEYVTDEEHNKASDVESEVEAFADGKHKKYVSAENNQDTSQDYIEENEKEKNKRENDKTDANEYDYDEEQSKREKREYSDNISLENKINQTDVRNPEANFKVPELDLSDTFLTEKDILEISKTKIEKKPDIWEKYPYYFENLSKINRNSPLRYAENLKFIPKKSKGGTEFYDSRNVLECPEVDVVIDPVPEKIKNNTTDTESTEEAQSKRRKKRQADFDQIEEQPRLGGLGDKIDCFKAKYFGENPLDSPFFKEDIISGPEPLTIPNIPSIKLGKIGKSSSQESKNHNIFGFSEPYNNKTSLFDILDKTKPRQSLINDSLTLRLFPKNEPQNFKTGLNNQSIYTGIIDNIRSKLLEPLLIRNVSGNLLASTPKNSSTNNTNIIFQNKEEVTKLSEGTVRRKRSATFIYEPYKIIKDSQIQESKKTTTTNNISPLIKQLQSSKIVHKVTSKAGLDKVHPVKRHLVTRPYKDIGKLDRTKTPDYLKSNSDKGFTDFVDVNSDLRRGEPRYEIKPPNHKSEYSPVENKKAMSIDDYEAHTKSLPSKNITITLPEDIKNSTSNKKQALKMETQKTKTTSRPFFDVSKFLPKPFDVESSAATKIIRRVVRTTTPSTEKGSKRDPVKQYSEEEDDDEESEEYEDNEEEEENEEVLTTTTTTSKPAFRRRVRSTTTTTTSTTPATVNVEKQTDNMPILRLVTRFRTPKPKITESEQIKNNEEKRLIDKVPNIVLPKYREKSKKSSKSTLLTDTKRYGDDNDDMRKEEIDALIGVKHNADDYVPLYEKEINNKEKIHYLGKKNEESNKNHNGDEDEHENEDVDEEEDEDEDDESESDEEDAEHEDDDEDDGEEEEDDRNESEEADDLTALTNTTPSRDIVFRTTEAPSSTTEVRSAKLELKPMIVKKKIEFHKEIPTNHSSPHVTQFKQDFKEVEIIKEYPQKKTRKNVEALDLYKDENLAKEVNKLDDVEVFKENLDISKGPKHGGNYRSAKLERKKPERTVVQSRHGGHLKTSNDDTEPSQSKDNIHKDDDTDIQPRKSPETILGSRSSRRFQNNARKNIKQIETLDTEKNQDNSREEMHEGPSNYNKDTGKQNLGDDRNAKLIELPEREHDSGEITDTGSLELQSRRKISEKKLHGGNYRSAKTHENDRNAKIIDPEESKHESGEITENVDSELQRRRENSRRRFHGGNFRHASNSEGDRNAKILEPEENKHDSEEDDDLELQSRNSGKRFHGGNYRHANINEDSNAKIIKRDESPHDSREITENGNGKSQSRRVNSGSRLHGGNYRSAKIVEPDDNNKDASFENSQEDNLKAKSERSKTRRNNAAVLLNSFVQAAPIFTTTPSYILDPSKRMYYYVDA